MRRRDSLEITGTFELALDEQARAAKVGHGYDPYETYPSVRRADSTARQTDLRRLSEWIRTQKQVEELKKSDSDEES